MDREECLNHIRSKRIVLFGAGNNARRFYKDFIQDLDISYCITNDKGEDFLLIGNREMCSVKWAVDYQKEEEEYIVVCADNYENMCNQLIDKGYRFGNDFIESSLFRVLVSKKKIALFYGVCYMRAIRNCLDQSQSFSEQYDSWYYLNYKKYGCMEYSYFLQILQMCDLFIYTNFLSQSDQRRLKEYKKRLQMNAQTISIPFIVFYGFYPDWSKKIILENQYCVISFKNQYSPFSNPDFAINRMIDEGRPLVQIKKTINDINYYDHKYLKDNLEKEFLKLKVIDPLSDIKIADFIIKNYKDKRLFLNGTHISNEVMIVLASEILEKLDLPVDFNIDEIKSQILLYTSEVPIYPSVIEHLNLNIYGEKPIYTLYTFKGYRTVTFNEYIELYVEFCYNMKNYIDQGFFPQ